MLVSRAAEARCGYLSLDYVKHEELQGMLAQGRRIATCNTTPSRFVQSRFALPLNSRAAGDTKRRVDRLVLMSSEIVRTAWRPISLATKLESRAMTAFKQVLAVEPPYT